MHISKISATYIVEEISQIIGEKINMMNDSGIIIASSDKSRIGTYHHAAKLLIDDKLQEIVVKKENEYKGAKPGLNLAINFNKKIVGVIGVTGPYEVVEKYGKIIKKMTEILLLDQFYKEQQEMDKRVKERFLDEWMFGDAKNITSDFVKQGISMNLDITIPRRVMIINYIMKEKINTIEQEHIIDSLNRLVGELLKDGYDSILYYDSIQLILAISERSDKDMIRIAQLLKHEIESKYDIYFCCGIDSNYEGYELIHTNVVKAMKACNTSLRSSQKGIRLYWSITMEIFQTELSSLTKREYINRIFKGCSRDEIQQWIGMLNVFYEEEGSITLAASRLYIHRNTLQYKLNKIKERTGYDPRSIRFSSLFYNAIHFYQDVRDEMIL